MRDNLTKFIAEDAISNSSRDLKIHSVGGKTPSTVIFPTSIDQVSEIIKQAQHKSNKILISGNSSQSNFGSKIENPDWCISISRMNRIVEHEAADLIVTVESGVTLYQLQKFLKKKGQFLPLDPINAEKRTLGGIVATNSSGSLKMQYGNCRDLILGMKVVLPDGSIIRAGGKTVKNVAGYDLSKLFIGSMGTLGVITEITFKLFPLSEKSQTLWADFDQFDKIPSLVKLICSSNLHICRCEYFNLPFVMQNLGNDYSANKLHSLLLSVKGHPEMVTTTVERLQQIVLKNGAKHIHLFSDIDEADFWNKVNSKMPCNEKANGAIHSQISLPKSNFGHLVNAVEKYSVENNLSITIRAHTGNGIIYICWTDLNEDHVNKDRWRSQIVTIRQIVENYQANMVIYQAPIYLREPALIWGEPDKNFSLMKAIKSKYDAHQVLVAGRFIGGL